MKSLAFFVWGVLGGAVMGEEVRSLDGSFFPMDVAGWAADAAGKRAGVRERILLAAGLLPLPEKTPLNAVVHGRVEREDYTIDRVYFESFPGHFVTGNLYLPKPLRESMPGVLCPHGHWEGGRFMDARGAVGNRGVEAQMAMGAERLEAAARSPLQARCVHLARMGCAVFHWDTLGNGDSLQIADHRSGVQAGLTGSELGTWGLYSVQADLHLQTNFGLQTWNSVRALDFLEGLPGVDGGRLAVTGASGGGTQTMMLGAIDERVKAAFPCVMVSTAMQGGCTCENSHYLRIGQGNVDIAAAMAPRALGLTSADDWTVELERKGFPELKGLYEQLGVPERLTGVFATQFPHNYNQVSRAAMYAFMNEHLELGLKAAALEERGFEFATKEELTVWTGAHAAPVGDAVGAVHEVGLMRTWAELSERAMTPEVRRAAWRMIGEGAGVPRGPTGDWLLTRSGDAVVGAGRHLGSGGVVNVSCSMPRSWNGWVEVRPVVRAEVSGVGASAAWRVRVLVPQGGEGLTTEGAAVLAEPGKGWKAWCGYRYGYNSPLLVRRAHELVAVVEGLAPLKAALRMEGEVRGVKLKGSGEMAGVAALAALMVGPEGVEGLEVEPKGFRFGRRRLLGATGIVPGAVKYGDLEGLLSACAPMPLTVVGQRMPTVRAAYEAMGAGAVFEERVP